MGQYYSPVSKMDVDNNSVVDDSERLGGQLPTHYLTKPEYDILTTNRYYYVDPDSGDDTNSGFEFEPFATLDKAFETLKTLDANGYRIYIRFTGTHVIPEDGWIISVPSRCRQLFIEGDDPDDSKLVYENDYSEYCFTIRPNGSIVRTENFEISFDETSDLWYWSTGIRAHGVGHIEVEEVRFVLPKQGACNCIELSGSLSAQIEDCYVVGHELNNENSADFLELRDQVRASARWCTFDDVHFYSLFSVNEDSILSIDSLEGTIKTNTRRFTKYDNGQILGYFDNNLTGGLVGDTDSDSSDLHYESRYVNNWDSQITIRDRYVNQLLIRESWGDVEYIIPLEVDSYIPVGFRVTIQKGNDSQCVISVADGVTLNGSADDLEIVNKGDYVILRKVGGNSWETFYGRQLAITGAEIKELYESEPDTNAYDDIEKAKVASLYYLPVPTVTSNHSAVDKTLIPCDSSAGSFTITLPTTGSLKIVDVVGTDINTGFGVNPVTLVPQGAQTIAGGEDDLVLDAGGANVIISLVGDDWRIIDLTVPALRVGPEWGDILDKPNFGSAALTDTSNYALAAQGAKADNAVQLTGDQSIAGKKTFTSPLILPDNSRINGVEHFYRSTKPTVRGDGSALVARDRWYKTDTGEEWFWNGSYWLSRWVDRLRAWTGPTGLGVSLNNQTDSPSAVGNVFIERAIYSFATMNSPQDGSNYWRCYWLCYTDTATITAVGILDSNTVANGTTVNTINVVNVGVALNNFLYVDGVFSKVGSPGNLRRSSMSLVYRLIAP